MIMKMRFRLWMRRKALVIVAILGCVTLLTIALSELSGHQMGTFSVKRLKGKFVQLMF